MRNKLAKAIRKDVQFVPANERANATRRNGEADVNGARGVLVDEDGVGGQAVGG